MLSDGRSIEAPLEKQHCDACGLIRHSILPSQAEIEAIFDQDYTLHTRLLNNSYEKLRQSRYADWIIDLLQGRAVSSVFEVGAGTGALMAELRRRSPAWKYSGVEPVAAAAAQVSEGLDIQVGLLRDIDTSTLHVDVVLSVNVIEHVHDPIAFLKQSRAALVDGGCVIVICPDGDRPTTEMLIYDHIHSFTARALEVIAHLAGFSVLCRHTAPSALGAFQAVLLVPGADCAISDPPISSLYDKRFRLMERWQKLDEMLIRRIGECSSLWAFGAGENAQLLRAYAPLTWKLVGGLLGDESGFFDGRPLSLYGSTQIEAGSKILLAVKPEVQGEVAQRLAVNGDTVIRWDDLVGDNAQ